MTNETWSWRLAVHSFRSALNRSLGRGILVAGLAWPALGLASGQFQNPINPGADPWLLHFEGSYYLTTTQGSAIRMWKAPTLAGLKTASPVTVWQDDDPTRSRGMWAPEFHFISNRWYLYYTATSSDNSDDNHRMHVLESAGTDPLGPYTYKARLADPANDQYAIDGSVFRHPGNGRWYFLWAARPGHVLTIAPMANPWTLAGAGVVIPASGFGCEEVREGPVVLHRNGRLFLVYSACDTGKPDYKLGMLIADEKADVMKPASWKQHPRPVFERNDANGVFGPGHNGFFRSPDGREDWIVYHGKTTAEYTYRGRTTRAQKFSWNTDGTPNFGTPVSLDAVLDEPSEGVEARGPFLHPLFSPHAVLQRERPVPIWGWSEPGSTVIVRFRGQEKRAVVGTDGKWLARLDPMGPSGVSRVLTVTNATTHQSTAIPDVLVGDVWLCSGQSNMEMGVELCDVAEDIATARFPQLRLLTVPRRVSFQPESTLDCQWLPCSPETLRQGQWGGFSAVGFFFGRELHRELGVPVGLIHSSWGGTVAEAWTSAEGLEPLADFADALARVQSASDPQRREAYEKAYADWCRRTDPGTRAEWQQDRRGGADWKTVEIPGVWEQAGLPDYDGMVWFRRGFEVPAAWSDRALILELGPIDDIDTTWINGVQVGQMNRYDLFRRYRIATGVAGSGLNTLTVRVLDTGGAGGFAGQPSQIRVRPSGPPDTEGISLAGPWQMRVSASLAELGAPPMPVDPGNPNVTTVLYNGMIAPLVPYGLKGAIWYQGESNADRAWQYRSLLPAMIQDWRNRFDSEEFPFLIVQLAAWQARHAEPREHNWAELREAQALTARTVPNCGLALALDVGDAADIHPKDKRTVGERLALCALAQAYGQNIEWSGPWYRSMRIDGNRVRLSFNHVDRGLLARGGRLVGFAVAGEDRRFVWGDAVIEGDSVVVAAPGVERPVAVRYAWDINPAGNLYNTAGLPAVPFRTDDWRLTTQPTR